MVRDAQRVRNAGSIGYVDAAGDMAPSPLTRVLPWFKGSDLIGRDNG